MKLKSNNSKMEQLNEFKNFLSTIIIPKLSFDSERIIRFPNNIKNRYGVIFDHLKFYKRMNECPCEEHKEEYNFVGFHLKNHQDGIKDQNYSHYIADHDNKPFIELFEDVLEQINKIVLCKSCGNISNIDTFNFKTDQCFGCDINDYLSKDNTRETCSICCEEHSNLYILRCGHKFHRKCIVKLSTPKKCPNCRECINEQDDYDEDDEDE